MPEIQRFEFEQLADEAAEQTPSGPWVRFEDHQQVVAAKQKQIDALHKGLAGEVGHYRALAENFASLDLVEVSVAIADRLQALLDSSGGEK